MKTFKFLPARMGSGWTGAYVAVDYFVRPESLSGTTEICLSADAQDADEFDYEIDLLIQELQELKAVGRRKFQSMK